MTNSQVSITDFTLDHITIAKSENEYVKHLKATIIFLLLSYFKSNEMQLDFLEDLRQYCIPRLKEAGIKFMQPAEFLIYLNSNHNQLVLRAVIDYCILNLRQESL